MSSRQVLRFKLTVPQALKLQIQPGIPASNALALAAAVKKAQETADEALRIAQIALALSGGGGSTGAMFPLVVTTSPFAVLPAIRIIVITRSAPTGLATTIMLSSVASRAGLPLTIIDYSSYTTEHVITVLPDGTEHIMGLPSWTLIGTQASVASQSFLPSDELGGWLTL